MSEDDCWTSISIRRVRLNGLRLMAAKENRTPGNMLELILKKKGVPEVTDEEYSAKVKAQEVSA